MTHHERTAAIMRRMGFPDDAHGKYVDELRHLVDYQIRTHGLQNRSGGSWGEGSERLTLEERAKHLLAWEWELAQGHTHRVEAMDGIVWTTTDVRTMKRRTRILWRKIPAWIGDKWRAAMCDLRVLWHRRILKRTNPYN